MSQISLIFSSLFRLQQPQGTQRSLVICLDVIRHKLLLTKLGSECLTLILTKSAAPAAPSPLHQQVPLPMLKLQPAEHWSCVGELPKTHLEKNTARSLQAIFPLPALLKPIPWNDMREQKVERKTRNGMNVSEEKCSQQCCSCYCKMWEIAEPYSMHPRVNQAIGICSGTSSAERIRQASTNDCESRERGGEGRSGAMSALSLSLSPHCLAFLLRYERSQ